ncbi:hypothetical protein ACIRST_37655 [Kitasatospora sp. NPDC101447]|uniref:hypothetical protein n=1 Tax=Kitasatospora sp. NPDC101447 TaxID=3364102 RepID=UPI00381C6944
MTWSSPPFPVRGIPRAWLTQLAKGGALAVPLAFGGRHPWVVAENHASGMRARLLTAGENHWPAPGDGLLYPDGGDTPTTRPHLPAPDPGTRRLSAIPALRKDQWADLWAYLAVHHPRHVAVARVEGQLQWEQTLALVDGDHAVYVRPDGLWATSDRRPARALADQAEQTILHWGVGAPAPSALVGGRTQACHRIHRSPPPAGGWHINRIRIE